MIQSYQKLILYKYSVLEKPEIISNSLETNDSSRYEKEVNIFFKSSSAKTGDAVRGQENPTSSSYLIVFHHSSIPL